MCAKFTHKSKRKKQHLSRLGSNQVSRVHTAGHVTTRTICFEINRQKENVRNCNWIKFQAQALFSLVEQYEWCAHSDWRTDRSTLNTVFLKCTERIVIDTNPTDMFMSLSNWKQQQKRRKIGENSWRRDYRETVWGPIAQHAILSIDIRYTLSIQEFIINCTTPNWVDDE